MGMGGLVGGMAHVSLPGLQGVMCMMYANALLRQVFSGTTIAC
jgi:hypothetical protein